VKVAVCEGLRSAPCKVDAPPEPAYANSNGGNAGGVARWRLRRYGDLAAVESEYNPESCDGSIRRSRGGSPGTDAVKTVSADRSLAALLTRCFLRAGSWDKPPLASQFRPRHCQSDSPAAQAWTSRVSSPRIMRERHPAQFSVPHASPRTPAPPGCVCPRQLERSSCAVSTFFVLGSARI